MSDEELLKAVGVLERRRMFGKILVVLAVVAVAAGATQFLPGDVADAGSRRWLIFAAVAAVCLAAGLALILSAPIPAEARRGALAMARAETLQTRRQASFVLMPLSLGLMLNGVLRAAGHALDGMPLRHLDMFIIGAFVAFLLVFALLLAGRGLDRWARPVLDDELSRALRGQALQLGYAILLPGVAILFVVGLFNRVAAIELAPILAALGIAGPALRLVWLERAAGAGRA